MSDTYVYGAQLLDDLSRFIARFVTLSPAQADVCALWVVHTCATDACEFTPYLDINSPALRSGKTRLLEVLSFLVHKPWFTGRVTGSALVRKVHKDHFTLLLDESDTAFQTRSDYGEVLRGILNTGFERDGTYSMCVPKGNDWEPRDFKTFSPKAIAGIGQLPATVRDRSIPIRMKRARRDDRRQRFRKAKVKPEADELRHRVEEWARVSLDRLREAQPELPDELNDRQQDVCEPLLAVADLAGVCWPARARAALVELCAGLEMPDDAMGLRLLADTRDIFTQQQSDRLPTSQLLLLLQTRDESPWSEFDHGRPLSAFRLSKLLKPFGVRPRDIRFDQGVQKGYLRTDLEDPWERYLVSTSVESGQEGQQRQQASVYAAFEQFLKGQQQPSVADAKSGFSPGNTRLVADVAPSAPSWGELEAISVQIGTKANGTNYCWVHPTNKTHWWRRGGVDPVCGLCHPNPAAT